MTASRAWPCTTASVSEKTTFGSGFHNAATPARARRARGLDFVAYVLAFVPPSSYDHPYWSLALLVVMLIQLLVLAPLEARLRNPR